MSGLLDIWRAGGPTMVPLALVCFGISFWIAGLYPRLRRIQGRAPEVLGLLDRPDGLDAAREWARGRRGSIARIVDHALAAGDEPRTIDDRLAEARRSEMPRFERELWVLRAMVAAAPLLGLLGTVRGMIGTFWVLSTRGVASLELLSGGISEALVTTQIGLVVAVPGLVGAHAVARRLSEIGVLLDRLGSRLVLRAGGNGEPR